MCQKVFSATSISKLRNNFGKLYKNFQWIWLVESLVKKKITLDDIRGTGGGYMGDTTLICQMGRKFLWHITAIINEFFLTIVQQSLCQSIWMNIFYTAFQNSYTFTRWRWQSMTSGAPCNSFNNRRMEKLLSRNYLSWKDLANDIPQDASYLKF